MKFYFLFLYMVNCEKIINHINIPSCRICICYRPFEFSNNLPHRFELERPLDLTILQVCWYKQKIDYVFEPKLYECLKIQNKGTYYFYKKNETEYVTEEKNRMIKIVKDKIIKFLPPILLILSIIVSSLVKIYIMTYLVSKSLI